MSAMIIQFAEEKAKRLSLRDKTGPKPPITTPVLEAYVRHRMQQYLAQKQFHQETLKSLDDL